MRLRPEICERAKSAPELDEAIGMIVESIRAYAAVELRIGRVRVLRSKEGIMHVAFDHQSCLCGWTWAGKGAKFQKRSGPVVGETAGWCSRCHKWAIEIAGSD